MKWKWKWKWNVRKRPLKFPTSLKWFHQIAHFIWTAVNKKKKKKKTLAINFLSDETKKQWILTFGNLEPENVYLLEKWQTITHQSVKIVADKFSSVQLIDQLTDQLFRLLMYSLLKWFDIPQEIFCIFLFHIIVNSLGVELEQDV